QAVEHHRRHDLRRGVHRRLRLARDDARGGRPHHHRNPARRRELDTRRPARDRDRGHRRPRQSGGRGAGVSRIAERIASLPPYPFARIDELKAEKRRAGVDLIDLGIGDPDLPTPPHIVAALREAATVASHHRYPSYAGMIEMRAAAAGFMARRFGVELDPATEVVALIGSKEGIAHAPLALVDPGDIVLCPDPGYPVYAVGTKFAGG